MAINLVGTWIETGVEGSNVVQFDYDGTWQKPGMHGPVAYRVTDDPVIFRADELLSPTREYIIIEPPFVTELTLTHQVYVIHDATRDQIKVELVASMWRNQPRRPRPGKQYRV